MLLHGFVEYSILIGHSQNSKVCYFCITDRSLEQQTSFRDAVLTGSKFHILSYQSTERRATSVARCNVNSCVCPVLLGHVLPGCKIFCWNHKIVLIL